MFRMGKKKESPAAASVAAAPITEAGGCIADDAAQVAVPSTDERDINDPNNDMEDSCRRWMRANGLSQYRRRFDEEGYDSVNVLKTIAASPADVDELLEDCGISKKGHVKHLKRCLQELADGTYQDDETLVTPPLIIPEDCDPRGSSVYTSTADTSEGGRAVSDLSGGSTMPSVNSPDSSSTSPTSSTASSAKAMLARQMSGLTMKTFSLRSMGRNKEPVPSGDTE
eukprot:TRINITY_DN82176_c0_g1_i1.p1 TRINITY_DN82176_c0_g1~~TRINITY_DN82176_c0_g1_i1.p1  ORF type:complete len:226 (-),score=46.82 TRINITY_DN82176_c0_g1_i1:143-820(-)